MLLQTNSYIVPKEKRAEHSRLIRRFRQTLLRLGCDHFEVYEQVGANWSNSESAGRYVQILRFLDRKHQLAVQAAERTDPTAQAVIADFCDLINFPYQQQQGLFAVGFYTSVLPVAPKRGARGELVSTVEHEVVSNPEDEKPYPGSSDGPPIEEAMADGAAIEENSPVDQHADSELDGNFPEEFEDSLDEKSEGELHGEPNGKFVPEVGSHEFLPEEGLEDEFSEKSESPSNAAHRTAPAAEHDGLGEDEFVVETVHSESTTEIPAAPAPSHSEPDFMKLVGSDLDGADEDDLSNGFIEAEFVEETEETTHGHKATEPTAHHEGQTRPPGW